MERAKAKNWFLIAFCVCMAGLYDGVCVPKPSDLGLWFGKFFAWKLDIEHFQHQNFQQRTKSLSCDLQDSVQDKRKQNQDKCIKPICLNVVVVNWHYYYNYHYYYQYCVGIKVCMLIIYSCIRGTCNLRKILQINFLFWNFKVIQTECI